MRDGPIRPCELAAGFNLCTYPLGERNSACFSGVGATGGFRPFLGVLLVSLLGAGDDCDCFFIGVPSCGHRKVDKVLS